MGDAYCVVRFEIAIGRLRPIKNHVLHTNTSQRCLLGQLASPVRSRWHSSYHWWELLRFHRLDVPSDSTSNTAIDSCNRRQDRKINSCQVLKASLAASNLPRILSSMCIS